MSDRQRQGQRRERRGRLSRSAEFDRVYRQGRSQANRFLVLYAFPREDGAAASESEAQQKLEAGDDEASRRLGVSVSRKVGGAVERNKVKRLLREAFWAESAVVPEDHDFVVVARPDVGGLAEREGLAGVQRELHELVGKLTGRPADETDTEEQEATS